MKHLSPPGAPATERIETIDALRGMAMVWMTVFHFCFDLNQFGYLKANFYDDAFWTWQRTAIVSLFLLTAGLGQAAAVHAGQSWGRFWRRWWQVAGCAVLVSAGSYALYPQSYIYFGVLHGVALMLILVRFGARLGNGLWWLGGAIIASKFIAVYAHQYWAGADFLNENAWNWLGLISRKPITQDYVPLVPWLGVVCWGMAAGRWLLVQRPGWLARARPMPALAWLGRHSLSYYMVHQPVLIGLLLAYQTWA